jgi:hypothetical protein
MEAQIFRSSSQYPTHYRLDVLAAVNNAQETNVHFNLQNITVLWNVTQCSLVSIYQATSQKTVVFPVTIVRNPDFTYTIHHCCNFMFAMKLENKAIAFVFLCVSVRWMYEKTVRIITAGSATSDVRVASGFTQISCCHGRHIWAEKFPFMNRQLKQTVRTTEINRLSYCRLQHYIFIRWRLPSDVEVPPFFLVKFGMFHELEIRYLISFFRGVLCTRVNRSWICCVTFVL